MSFHCYSKSVSQSAAGGLEYIKLHTELRSRAVVPARVRVQPIIGETRGRALEPEVYH